MLCAASCSYNAVFQQLREDVTNVNVPPGTLKVPKAESSTCTHVSHLHIKLPPPYWIHNNGAGPLGTLFQNISFQDLNSDHVVPDAASVCYYLLFVKKE